MAFPYKLKWEKGRFDPKSKEPYTISRSKVERFLECPRCYWLEARHGIGRPDSFPFTLNNAVDELFKKEFDAFRAQGKPHPIMVQHNIDAVPFNDPRMDEWRDAFKRGVKVLHEPTNMIFRGGVDDIWVKPDGEIYVVDYKATAGKDTVTLDDEWKDGYKRQVEMYQWLFRHNGFKVSPTAYFVYANGLSDRDAFDAKLEFDVTLLSYEGDDSWVEKTLGDLKNCLLSETPPKKSADCTYCPYREHAGLLLMKLQKEKKAAS